jgi:hypothetical protein
MPSSLSALNFFRPAHLCLFIIAQIGPIRSQLGLGYNPGMNFEGFQGTLNDEGPPEGVSPLLAALWWEARGDWTKAHEIAQEIESPDGAWVHAYLHRKEGDQGNAGYWYRRAGRPHSRAALEAEWEEIARQLLLA